MQTTDRSNRACAILMAALALAAGLPGLVFGQSGFPSRTISIVVPAPPGGALDLIARLMAPKLSQEFGQQVIVDNRAGAAGVIGSMAVVRAQPDGHTALLTTGVITLHPTTHPNAGYDSRKDLAPVSLLASSPWIILAHPSLPVKNIPELLAYAKANPNKVFYGSSGIGSSTHIVHELFNGLAGVEMVHVPYQGNGPMLVALMANQIQLGMEPISGGKPLGEAGKLRMLAVTGKTRNQTMPDLPTVLEGGVQGFDASLWEGLFLPKDTPEPTIAKWNAALIKVINDPALKKRFTELGFDVIGSTPQALGSRVNFEVGQWAEVIKKAKIVVD